MREEDKAELTKAELCLWPEFGGIADLKETRGAQRESISLMWQPSGGRHLIKS